MTRLEELREQWAADLARIEDGHADEQEHGTAPWPPHSWRE